MKKLLRFSLMMLFAMIGSSAMAQEVTLDFTLADPSDPDGKTSSWGFPSGSSNKLTDEESFTYDGYTVKVAGPDGYYWHNKDHYLLFGKQGATLTLPAFDFDVERITVEGTGSASEGILLNVFVNGEAVSTETKGLKNVTQEFEIAEGSQAAGTIYTLKVNSKHNAQVKTIKIYKATGGPVKTATTLTLSNVIYGGLDGDELGVPDVTVVDAEGNEVPGAEIIWSSKNEDVAVIKGDIIKLMSPGKTTITATYAGDDDYKGSSASYSLDVIAEAENFASIQETATKSAVATIVDMQNVQVTMVHNYKSQNGNQLYNVYLTDQNHCGVMIYASGEGNDPGLKAGQILNGYAYTKKQLYYGTYELTNFSKTGLTITDGTVNPWETTIYNIGLENQSALVTIKGVKYYNLEDGEIFTDGDFSIGYYDQFGVEPELIDGETYDVTAIVTVRSEEVKLSPRTAADIALPTNIKNTMVDTDVTAPIYSLDGRRVDQNYRGVVIQNGVKRIQK